MGETERGSTHHELFSAGGGGRDNPKDGIACQYRNERQPGKKPGRGGVPSERRRDLIVGGVREEVEPLRGRKSRCSDSGVGRCVL